MWKKMLQNCYIFPNWYVFPNWYAFFNKSYQLRPVYGGLSSRFWSNFTLPNTPKNTRVLHFIDTLVHIFKKNSKKCERDYNLFRSSFPKFPLESKSGVDCHLTLLVRLPNPRVHTKRRKYFRFKFHQNFKIN